MSKNREAQRIERLSSLNPDKYDITPVRLIMDFGFVNEYDAVYSKRAGAIITNPIEITELRKRKAPLEYV